jgi:hypothetical protein
LQRYLGDAQKESIHKLGIKLAEKLGDKRYDNMTPKKLFIEYYGGRSALIHGSIDSDERPEPGEIQRRLPHLQQFVMDLLEVEAASADEGRQTGGGV